jgi:cytochrome c551/c552
MLKTNVSKLALSLFAMAGLAVLVGTALGNPDASAIKKIAELVKKGDLPAAKKMAAEYAKKHADLEDLMHGFKPAKKGGIGVTGSDQGIEQTLNKIGRDAPTAAAMTKMAKSWEEMGYDIAALGLITAEFAPEKDSGKKTRKAWVEWSEGMVDSGKALSAAAKSAAPADVKTQASKVNNSCNSCHSLFR